jgi:RNAse (barnase) inhibitor barstar
VNAMSTLFQDQKNAGVYKVSTVPAIKDIEKQAKALHFAFFQIEGQKIEKKEQFLNHAALAMHFPDHFGNNWDAFEDCLTDLSWVDAEGYVILFDHIDPFAQHSPGQFDTLVEIFQSAVDVWREQGKPMFVLLHGNAGAEFGLKTLKL